MACRQEPTLGRWTHGQGTRDLPGFQEEHLRTTFGAWYPNVEFTFITDSGHFPMDETPVYLAGLVERFLAAHR